MIAELAHADDNRAALSFAGGCLIAALRERLRDEDSQIVAATWSIAVITALFALDRFVCAARGLSALLGAQDGMRDALLRHGASSVVVERYDGARPIVAGCFLALGVAQLATAWHLSRMQIRSFAAAWCLALLIAVIAVAIQLSVVPAGGGLPSEFDALLMQAVAVPALLVWFRRRPTTLERK